MFDVTLQVESKCGVWQKTVRLPCVPFVGMTIESTVGWFDVDTMCWNEESGTLFATGSLDEDCQDSMISHGWSKAWK